MTSPVSSPGRENKQEYGHKVELHVVGQIPTPDHAELLERVPVVDVQDVPPPVVVTRNMVVDARTEHWLIVGVLQRQLIGDNGDQVDGGQSEVSVDEHHAGFHRSLAEESKNALLTTCAFSLAKEEKSYEETTEEEERVHGKTGIADHLVSKGSFRDYPSVLRKDDQGTD